MSSFSSLPNLNVMASQAHPVSSLSPRSRYLTHWAALNQAPTFMWLHSWVWTWSEKTEAWWRFHLKFTVSHFKWALVLLSKCPYPTISLPHPDGYFIASLLSSNLQNFLVHSLSWRPRSLFYKKFDKQKSTFTYFCHHIYPSSPSHPTSVSSVFSAVTMGCAVCAPSHFLRCALVPFLIA